MPAPTITGTVSGQTTTSETPIDPFSGVTMGDVNAGATDMLSITLSGPGSLSGTGLSGSDGSYTLMERQRRSRVSFERFRSRQLMACQTHR